MEEIILNRKFILRFTTTLLLNRRLASLVIFIITSTLSNGQNPSSKVVDSSKIAEFSKDFYTITEYVSCKSLIDSVKNSWQLQVKDSFYKSVFTPIKRGSKEIHYPCMTSLKRPDAEILFGKPNKPELNYGLYYTSKPYKLYLPNSFVKITYTKNRLASIKEFSCPGTDKFIKTNFKLNQKTKLYKTPLIPKSFGIDTVHNECLRELSSAEFISVLGKPTLKFSGEVMMGMQKIEWDESGNEVQKAPLDNKVTWLRYLTDTNGINKNNGFEVKVSPDHQYTTVIAYNCNHAKDTLQAKWKFNSDKKYFECRLNWTQLDLMSKCLYGISKTEVLSLMGQPSKKTELVLEYYLGLFPYEHVAEPDRIVVTFDKTNRLVSFIQQGALLVYSRD